MRLHHPKTDPCRAGAGGARRASCPSSAGPRLQLTPAQCPLVKPPSPAPDVTDVKVQRCWGATRVSEKSGHLQTKYLGAGRGWLQKELVDSLGIKGVWECESAFQAKLRRAGSSLSPLLRLRLNLQGEGIDAPVYWRVLTARLPSSLPRAPFLSVSD